jgi:uncharacterized protein (DUF1697 family)
MTVWVLLLHGINVGGAGKLPMPALKAVLEGLGCAAVATYIQSGNAVFRSGAGRGDLAGAIGDGIEAGHGFRPAVFLLTAAELAQALAENPWPEAAGDARPMHFFFHDGTAEPDRAALDALLAEGEAWALTGSVLYFRATGGIGRSKFVEKLPRLFKAGMTARNLNTCRKLAEMASAL